MVLKADGGLVGLSVATAGGNLIDYGIRWRIAYRIVPQLRVNPRWATWASEGSHGFWRLSFLDRSSQRLISASSAILIGLFLPAAAIARFALAVNLVQYLDQVFAPSGMSSFPPQRTSTPATIYRACNGCISSHRD